MSMKMWMLEIFSGISLFILVGIFSFFLCKMLLNKLFTKPVEIGQSDTQKSQSSAVTLVSVILAAIFSFCGYQYSQKQPVENRVYEELGREIAILKEISPIAYKQIATEFAHAYEDRLITRQEKNNIKRSLAEFWDEESRAAEKKKMQKIDSSLQHIVKDSIEFDAENYLTIDQQIEQSREEFRRVNMEINALIEKHREEEQRDQEKNYHKTINILKKDLEMMK